jgi:tRNA-dihydrouridine synthase A
MNTALSLVTGQTDLGSSVTNQTVVHPISVAPMMDRTDRHFRYFMRQITRRTLLYTEMVTSAAILHGDRHRLLGFSLAEKPLALQVGGDDPKILATCAQIAEEMGYDEINLNVGCPSDRVQSGHFGACLMAKPQVVADCVAAMVQNARIPVTVKHRIGIDDQDRYEDMVNFVQTVAMAGCTRFTVHARKAWLKGLSPKENRDVPPLRYGDVYQLKQDFPTLVIEINGGIQTLEQVQTHLNSVDAVMIGRAAYDRPYLFSEVDRRFYGAQESPRSRQEVAEAMMPYAADWIEKGLKPHKITRHLLQLFAGQPGSRLWKRYLTERASKEDSDIIQGALRQMRFT